MPVTLMMGCQGGSGNRSGEMPGIASIPLDTLPAQPLPLRLLGSDTLFGQPEFVELLDNVLIVTDEKGIPFVHAVGLEVDFGVTRSWGSRGEGPGEFQSIMNLTMSMAPTPRLWAFDVRLQRLTDVEEAGWPGRTGTPATVMLATDQRIMRALWLDDSTIVGIGRHDSNRVVLFDRSGSVRRTVAGSLIGPEEIPEQVRATASSGVAVCVHPEGDQVAIFFTGEGRGDLFEDSTLLQGHFDVPITGSEAFQEVSPGIWQPQIARIYYLSCAADDRYVYALFSGRGSADYTGLDLFAGEILHVFDWNGAFVRAFHLTLPLSRLGLAGDGRLFGTRFGSVDVYGGGLPGRGGQARTGQ